MRKLIDKFVSIKKIILISLIILCLLILGSIVNPNNTVSVKNSIRINKPQKLVFDYLTIPCYWADYLPTTVAVKPASEHPMKIGERVTEYLNVLGVKVQIVWECIKNDNHANFQINGTSKSPGISGTVKFVLTLSEEDNTTIVKREIYFQSDDILFKISKPMAGLYFKYEAVESFRRAREILESMPPKT